MTTLDIEVRRAGNRATLNGPFGEIFFEIDDPDVEIIHDEFAVWAGLPFAMTSGVTLRFDVPMDPAVVASAHRVSRIWNAWLPKLWHMVQIEADPAEPRASSAKDHVMAFSGGGDSSYAMARFHEALNIKRAFTMHGFDFRFSDDRPFQILIDKNRQIAESFGIRLTVVRTDLFQRIPYWYYSQSMSLAAVIWLFAGAYARGHFAADFARYQDFMAFPWGSNGETNRAFQGSAFGIDPLGDDVTKGRKLATLLDYPEIAKRMTFCFNANLSGRNCGRCDKCVRIKLWCLAYAGTARPIFDDDVVTDDAFRTVEKYKTRPFTQQSIRDLYQEFALKNDQVMAERLAAMILPNAKLHRHLEAPRPWWRINLNLRKRLGLRRRH